MEYLIYNGQEYGIVDTLEYITMADSFVKNKIGTGHGEAKLYVGNESEKLSQFFGDFDCDCIFRKSDFEEFLQEAESEFKDPQQEYVKKDSMPKLYEKLCLQVKKFDGDILPFKIYRVDVEPPRVYINSQSDYYDFMRSLGLPNISYISVLKLKSSRNHLLYYFKIFIDYKSDTAKYIMKSEQEQEENIIRDNSITEKNKKRLINSRTGQGEYRKKLLEECPYCPFTMVSDERLLVASHIKPWVLSNEKEKIDPKNGFMLTPTYDWLFDRGFITFEDNKKMLVSPWISPMNQKRLGIYTGKIIHNLPLDSKRKKYVKFHREHIFKR